MTKREIVLAAFEHFVEYVEDSADENGWIKREEHSAFMRNHFYLANNIETKFVDKVEYWRPKSLEGIEDNNGWVKIESEADLPKEDLQCWLIDEEFGTDIGYFSFSTKKWFVDCEQFVTHYKPIIKPEPPKY